jgi:glycosyltransferase involved in cell wall biosynthesis
MKGWPCKKSINLDYSGNNWPKITIITPSFNQGHYIEETILSVINQNYPNLEYIIIDGGSKDETVEIIKKYEKHISCWISEPDKGQSDAINKGLKIVTGDIVNWLNSDDYLAEGALIEVARQFMQNKNALCVAGASIIISSRGEELRCTTGSWVDFSSKTKTLSKLIIEQPATFFKTEAVNKMGDLNAVLHFVMDKEWWLKFLIQFDLQNIVKINFPLVYFRLHEQSKTVSQQVLFPEDHATLLYSLCKLKNFDSDARLLAMKYKINTSYYFDEALGNQIPAGDVKQMVYDFFIKYYSNIYSSLDFALAKEFLRIYPDYPVNSDYITRFNFKRLKSIVRARSWFLYRIDRKIKAVFNWK